MQIHPFLERSLERTTYWVSARSEGTLAWHTGSKGEWSGQRDSNSYRRRGRPKRYRLRHTRGGRLAPERGAREGGARPGARTPHLLHTKQAQRHLCLSCVGAGRVNRTPVTGVRNRCSATEPCQRDGEPSGIRTRDSGVATRRLPAWPWARMESSAGIAPASPDWQPGALLLDHELGSRGCLPREERWRGVRDSNPCSPGRQPGVLS